MRKTAWIFVLALLLCGGCQRKSEDHAFPEKDSQQNMDEAALSQGEENVMPDYGESFSAILRQGNEEFWCGYPVDESFLGWIAGHYGVGMLEQVRGYLDGGGESPEFWHRVTGQSIHVLWLRYCQEYQYATYQLDNVIWRLPEDPNRIKLEAVGDINFSEDWYTMNAYGDRGEDFDACISAEVQQELQSADATIVNNEFTYSLRGEPLEGKAYVFRADPERVKLLDNLGCDIAALGNNHVYDYGEDALIDTFDTLDAAGIPYVGAGHNIEEASNPQYVVAGGYKIAVVCATQIERYSNYTKEAGEDSPGVLKTVDARRYVAAIRNAKKNCDYVIAYVHWGTEGILTQTGEVRELAKQFAKAGADLIIGNHPHRLQGAGFINEVPVLYSLGNFWFSDGSLYTAIAQIRVTDEGISVGMLPCKQEDVTTTLITEEAQRQAFYQYIADISENTAIDEEGFFHDLSRPGVEEELGEQALYRSGSNYGVWTGAYDLQDVQIDIVGNRIQ